MVIPKQPAPATKPNQPAAPTATAGDGQVSLTWTKPGTGGREITDYIIEYSSDGRNRWVTYNDGVNTKTSAVVSPLVNGTTYDFRISAVNAIGTSVASSHLARARATPTLSSDTSRPMLAFERSSYTVNENAGTLVMYFTCDDALPNGAFLTTNDADNNIDVSGLQSIAMTPVVGGSGFRTRIEVPVNDRPGVQGSRTITMRVNGRNANPDDNANLGQSDRVTITILDDDVPVSRTNPNERLDRPRNFNSATSVHLSDARDYAKSDVYPIYDMYDNWIGWTVETGGERRGDIMCFVRRPVSIFRSDSPLENKGGYASDDFIQSIITFDKPAKIALMSVDNFRINDEEIRKFIGLTDECLNRIREFNFIRRKD